MKTKIVCIFLLMVLSISAFAQSFPDNYKVYQKKSRIPESVKVISIYAGSIILDAVGDGLNDSGEKGWGHACNALSTGLLLVSPFVIDYDKSKWGYYLASYVCLRISLFDYSYNLTRGLPLNYIGNTSTWDKGLKKLNPPNTYLGRGVFFTVGISIPINEFDSKKRHRR